MFGLLKSLGDLAVNVADVALTPVEMAVDLANAVVQPLADAAETLRDDVKGLSK